MVYLFIFIFALYTIYEITLGLLQIRFVSAKAKCEPVVLTPKDYAKSAVVAIANEKFSICSKSYSFVLLVFWSLGAATWLQDLFKFENTLLSGSAFVVAFLVLNMSLSLPLQIYKSFKLDKGFGFSNLTPRLFIIDTLKSLVLSAVFGGAFVWALLFCFEWLGNLWWIWAFALTFCVIVLLNIVYPTLIAPIFNKMTPLEYGELSRAINSLLESCGFKSSGVFVMDASKRDNRLNAYFGGLGNTKRVVLFDTLIEKLSKEEILAVLGHELGHFKHGDLLKNIALTFFVSLALFGILGNIPINFYSALGLEANGASLLVFFMLYSPVLTAIVEPLMSSFSRSHEFGADNFGANITNKSDMISALRKLGGENKAFPLAHPFYSFVYHSHPSLAERINELENS